MPSTIPFPPSKTTRNFSQHPQTTMQPPSLLLLLLLLLHLHLQWRTTEATFVCNSTSGYFSTYGDYSDNLKALLRDMASTTAAQGYYLSSAGSSPDKVFGAAVCMQLDQRSLCQTCMDTATSEALTECPNYKEAMGVYSDCALEWSDRDLGAIFSSPIPHLRSPPPPPPPYPWESSPPPPLPTAPPVAGNGGGGGKESTRVYAVAVPVVVAVFAMVVAVVAFVVAQRRRGVTVFPPSPPSGLPVIQPLRPQAWQWPQRAPVPPPTPPPQPQQQDIVHFNGEFAATPYSFKVLSDATNGFAKENRLGEGGFGPVYKRFHPSDGFLKSLPGPKGILTDGQEVAIKRLDAVSIQGERQLKTEVLVVTQLQHKNLVRVLGYCIEGKEVLLVYEFMPNTSLDNFLRDPKRRKDLAWETRFKIIKGIARGLLYLHEDSRQTVIHRDMKTSNILLDAKMNAKISDFGLAALHDDSRTYATSKVAGTWGYIAPEFLMNGMYSPKSDIYSFGIMILEVVTGRLVESFGRNSIKKFVIEHWNDEQVLQVVDACLGGLYPENEVVACLYIGLMCCQENRKCRPTTEQVVSMLNSLPPISQLSSTMF